MKKLNVSLRLALVGLLLILDELIHVSQIHPLEKNLVQIKIVIRAGFIPRNLSVQDKIICASADGIRSLM